MPHGRRPHVAAGSTSWRRGSSTRRSVVSPQRVARAGRRPRCRWAGRALRRRSRRRSSSCCPTRRRTSPARCSLSTAGCRPFSDRPRALSQPPYDEGCQRCTGASQRLIAEGVFVRRRQLRPVPDERVPLAQLPQDREQRTETDDQASDDSRRRANDAQQQQSDAGAEQEPVHEVVGVVPPSDRVVEIEGVAGHVDEEGRHHEGARQPRHRSRTAMEAGDEKPQRRQQQHEDRIRHEAGAEPLARELWVPACNGPDEQLRRRCGEDRGRDIRGPVVPLSLVHHVTLPERAQRRSTAACPAGTVSGMRAFVRRLAITGSLVAAVVVPVTSASSTSTADPQFASVDGLTVQAVQQLDSRNYDVSVLSANLGRPVHIRVLLPVHYADNPDARYPVLYLFHGTSGRASDWEVTGDAENTTAPYDVITVMPECGFDGDGGFWFTDWVDQTTSHGPSQFESYLIDQLVPWVDDSLRTIPARRGRAVAGLSQGGYGAAEMAARHPDMFAAMASFSGAPEIDRDPDVIVGATAGVQGIAVGGDGVPPGSMFGSRATNEINWQGHDPSTLMTNLRGMRLFLWTGLGAPGPYDPTPPEAGAVGIEMLVHQSTQYFHQHLVEAGIPHFYDDYTDGTHSWGYWARDLREFMQPMMAAFAAPTTPTAVSYTSIDKSWQQWGWSVSWTRSADQQFSTLDGATAAGFTLTGGGLADVVTPAVYSPGQLLQVSVDDGSGADVSSMTADDGGRLHLVVSLSDGLQPATAIVRVR